MLIARRHLSRPRRIKLQFLGHLPSSADHHRNFSSSNNPASFSIFDAINNATDSISAQSMVALSPVPPSSNPSEMSFNDLSSTSTSFKEISTDLPISTSPDTTQLNEKAIELLNDIDNSAIGSGDWITVAELAASNYPHHFLLRFLDYIHTDFSCPWWQTIVFTTLSVRFALLPLAVKGLKNSSRMAHMQPELKLIQERMQADPRSKGPQADPKTQLAYRDQMQALFRKWDCNPMKAMALPLFQMPIFMSFFFGCKNLGNVVEWHDDVITGGTGFFTDLTVADASGMMIFPICCSLTFLAMIEVGSDGMDMSGKDPQKKMMKNVFRGLGVFMIPATMYMPQAVFMYWVTNNTFSLAQTIALKPPAVREYFGIMAPPKPVPGAEGGMSDLFTQIKKLTGDENAGKPPAPVVFNQKPGTIVNTKAKKGRKGKASKKKT